jgi:hypothetical protein
MPTTTKRGKRSTSRRRRLRNRAGTFFAKRTRRGRFKELDEKGRSLTTDRHRKARTTVKSGYGDQGDRR